MPLDPIRISEARAWLGKALEDLRAAEHDLKAVPPLLHDVVFHCQQAAEKVMKAYLCWHDQSFRKTHNLELLGEACLVIDPSLRSCVDSAVPLTEYAWLYRYPGEQQELERDEAETALALARATASEFSRRLPEQVRS